MKEAARIIARLHFNTRSLDGEPEEASKESAYWGLRTEGEILEQEGFPEQAKEWSAAAEELKRMTVSRLREFLK